MPDPRVADSSTPTDRPEADEDAPFDFPPAAPTDRPSADLDALLDLLDSATPVPSDERPFLTVGAVEVESPADVWRALIARARRADELEAALATACTQLDMTRAEADAANTENDELRAIADRLATTQPYRGRYCKFCHGHDGNHGDCVWVLARRVLGKDKGE